MKLSHMVIPVMIILAILSVFSVKRGLEKETNRLREEKKYQGISMEGEVVWDVETINLISSEGVFSADITAQDIFNLEAFVESRSEQVVSGYVEAYYRVRESLNNWCAFYEIEKIAETPEKIKESFPSTYVEIIYGNPHTFRFRERKDWVLEEVKHLLYDVEKGTLWYGSEVGSFSYRAFYSAQDLSFAVDSDFISLVKGEFHF